MAIKKISEKQLHLSVAKFLFTVLDTKAWTTIEISNQQGGRMGLIKQAVLKSKGAKTGWPDIQIFWPVDNLTAGLCIELKCPGNNITTSQLACHKDLAEANIPTVICRSIGEVSCALVTYNVPHRNVIL